MSLFSCPSNFSPLPHVQLVNARFRIIQSMLNIWIEHHHYTHSARLDIIVLVLIAIQVRWRCPNAAYAQSRPGNCTESNLPTPNSTHSFRLS
jgi:hypothetical protein